MQEEAAIITGRLGGKKYPTEVPEKNLDKDIYFGRLKKRKFKEEGSP